MGNVDTRELFTKNIHFLSMFDTEKFPVALSEIYGIITNVHSEHTINIRLGQMFNTTAVKPYFHPGNVNCGLQQATIHH